MTRWLIEYSASLVAKYSVGADGKTAYENLPGRKCREKIVELGERVMYNVPKAQRAELDKI